MTFAGAGVEVADGFGDFCSTGGLGFYCAGEYEGHKLKKATTNASRPQEESFISFVVQFTNG